MIFWWKFTSCSIQSGAHSSCESKSGGIWATQPRWNLQTPNLQWFSNFQWIRITVIRFDLMFGWLGHDLGRLTVIYTWISPMDPIPIETLAAFGRQKSFKPSAVLLVAKCCEMIPAALLGGFRYCSSPKMYANYGQKNPRMTPKRSKHGTFNRSQIDLYFWDGLKAPTSIALGMSQKEFLKSRHAAICWWQQKRLRLKLDVSQTHTRNTDGFPPQIMQPLIQFELGSLRHTTAPSKSKWAVFKTPVGWWLVRGLYYPVYGQL